MPSLKKQKAVPYLSVAEMKEIADELREKYQDAETRVFAAPGFLRALRTHLRPSDKVLDLGSANGHVFTVLHELGLKETYGADIENFLVKGFPTRGLQTFDFNRDVYPYADASFDAVTSIETVEHLENPFHFAREIARLLKPGGVLILSTPNPNHAFNKILFVRRGEFYRFLAGNDHISILTDPILKKGFLTHFELVETSYLLPEMPWRFLRRFTYPANKHFGRVALYVFRKK